MVAKPFRLSRRTLLRGTGACIALPLLDAMDPGTASADTDRLRLITVVFPHGIDPDSWHPSGSGSGWNLSTDLAPLARHKAKLLSVAGLDRSEPGSQLGDHPRGYGSLLTQQDLERGSRRNGVSFDQVAAQGALGDRTPRIRSLSLAPEGQAHLGGNDGGFDTYLGSYLSWSSADSPVPPIIEPREAFDRLFADFTPGTAPPSTPDDFTQRRRRSVFDFAQTHLGRLTTRLGSEDRRRVEEYATRLRALESSVFAPPPAMPTPTTCSPGPGPGSYDRYPEKLTQMYEIMALAVECDVTRVMTLNLGDTYSGLRPSRWGVSTLSNIQNDGLHTISHENYRDLSRVNQWWAEQFALFLDRLDAIDEGGQTALDNSVVLFMSEMERASNHRGENMPILLAGRGCGRITTDRRLVAAGGTPMANLYISLLDLAGTPTPRFGAYGDSPLNGFLA